MYEGEDVMSSRATETNSLATVPKTMTAMVQEKYGNAVDVLESRQVPVPSAGDGQLLVKVHSSSVNALEWHLMNGKPYLFRPVFGLRPKRPTLGADFSGTIAGVGGEVDGFDVGDEVFGSGHAGAYAEYLATSASNVALKPGVVSFEDAAAIGVAGLTALQGLRDIGELRSGDKVLINGSSGGVGTYAVQIAKALGAEVTAVCSSRNAAAAAALGADRVIEYESEDFTATNERFDLIFDGPGNRSLRACKRLLKAGGCYVMFGGPKGNWMGPAPRIVRGKLLFMFGDKRHASFTSTTRADDLVLLGELLASGKVRSAIEGRFHLAEVSVPLDRQGQFHAQGKTVVVVEGTV
jgi:NADPH:quinone reductase-like Zn-dependent oxidoreductase